MSFTVSKDLISKLGSMSIRQCESFGSFLLYTASTVHEGYRGPYRGRLVLAHMEFIGNQSLVIIVMSAFSIGAVFALQVGMVFKTFSAEGQMGVATATALARELAPMMTAFLIAGRAGSAITAEIATMNVNEQVDALEAMGVSPINYLVVPRLLAAMIMVPLLSAIFVLVGLIGSFVVGVLIFDVDQGAFFSKIFRQLTFRDIFMGLEKSFMFSIVIALVSCRRGLKAKGGAKGVGQSTTNAVILSLLAVLLLDFIYTFFQIVI